MHNDVKPDNILFDSHGAVKLSDFGCAKQMEDALTPLWSRMGGGCHLNRDTAAAIRSAGFDIESLDRFRYAPLRFSPAQAHILGVARTPGA